jgi:hypothetical protein
VLEAAGAVRNAAVENRDHRYARNVRRQLRAGVVVHRDGRGAYALAETSLGHGASSKVAGPNGRRRLRDRPARDCAIRDLSSTDAG